MRATILACLSLLTLCSVKVGAVDVARVCQASATNPNPVDLNDCKGYGDYVSQKYPNGTVYQTDIYAGCQTVYTKGSCKIDICAFPGQGVDVATFKATTDDILNNCQAPVPNTLYVYTGGYNIIKGTNVTVGVLSNYTPFANRCTVTDSMGASTDQCVKALDSINPASNLTQSSTSGCTVVAGQGSCFMHYCDAVGSRMSGADFINYMSFLIYNCNANGKTSGFTMITSNKRVGVYNFLLPSSVSSSTPICKTYKEVGGPRQSILATALTDIPNRYPSTITQSQSNAECTPIYINGDFQVDLCGQTGQKVATSQVTSALKQINGTCSTGGTFPDIGGYIRIPNSNVTLSLSANGIYKNMWCNTSPNNSPKESDCSGLKANASALYTQTGSTQGCTLLTQNGRCKVNFCAPPGATISGSDLINAWSNIIYSCRSSSYVSGIWQMSPNVSVSVYDPPNRDQFGDIACTNDGDHPNTSPFEDDCNILAEKWIANPTVSNCNSVNGDNNPKTCTIIDSYKSCGIAICQNKRNITCDYLGSISSLMIHSCFSGYNGNYITSSTLGVRNPAFGDHQIIMYNAQLQPFGPYKKKDGSPQKRSSVEFDSRNLHTRRTLAQINAENQRERLDKRAVLDEIDKAMRATNTTTEAATLIKRTDGDQPPDFTALPPNSYQLGNTQFYVRPVLGSEPDSILLDSESVGQAPMGLMNAFGTGQQYAAARIAQTYQGAFAQAYIHTTGEHSLEDTGITRNNVASFMVAANALRSNNDPNTNKGPLNYPNYQPNPAFFSMDIIARIPGAGTLYRVIGRFVIYGVFTSAVSRPM